MQLKGILNKSALSAKVFPLPRLALQQEFATFVAQVDKSALRYRCRVQCIRYNELKSIVTGSKLKDC